MNTDKRLQTILSHRGVASRRGVIELIENGKITVNGVVVKEKGLRVDPSSSIITVNGKPLPADEKNCYFLFNKPKGVISTVKDTHDRRKISDFFASIDARVYPVGRLDRDTTGIILVTNDGDLTHRLSHPSFGIEKEYLVTIWGHLHKSKRELLEKGIKLEGKMTSPCKIKLRRRVKNTSQLRVYMHEGKKRQIRRMFEYVGLKVNELDRVKYAGLKLGILPRGEFRELTKGEVKKLKRL
jgi:23S rRNA pseudouridine2605 synthase